MVWGHLLDYGRLAWKEDLLRIGKSPDKQDSLLLEFDKLWRVRHFMCYGNGKEILWCLQRPKFDERCLLPQATLGVGQWRVSVNTHMPSV